MFSIGFKTHSQERSVAIAQPMLNMYWTVRQTIAPQNRSAEHLQVPKHSDLSNLACQGTLDQPRSANRSVRIIPTETPECRIRIGHLSVASRIWILIISGQSWGTFLDALNCSNGA